MNNEHLLSTEDAANLLGLAPSTLNTYRTTGKGPKYVKIEGRTIRYPLSELLEYAFQSIEDSTSVQNTNSLSLLLDNSNIRNELQTTLNHYNTQGIIDRSNIIKKYMSKDNVKKLPWAFDKLVLNFELTKEEVDHLIIKINEKSNEGLVVGQEKSGRHFNIYRANLKKGSKTGITILFDDPDKVFKHKIQVQLNPSHFDKKKGKKLRKIFKCLFGKNYEDLLSNSHVSRLDICMDWKGVFPDSVIYRFKGTRKRHTVKTIKSGQTAYLAEGSRRRNRCKKYLKGDNETTRIEFEFYPKNKELQFKDILDFEMPFKRFEIYSPEFLLCGSVHPHTIHAIDVLGITGMLASLNCPTERKRLKKVLKEHLIMQNPEQFQSIATSEMEKFMHLISIS